MAQPKVNPKSSGRPAPPPVCLVADGVALTLLSPPVDGGIFRAQLTTSAPIHWQGREVPARDVGGGRWEALLPVPLGVRGPQPLEVAGATFQVEVRSRPFREATLTVDPRFSRPAPERATAEETAIGHAASNGAALPLWSRPFARPVPGGRTSPFGERRLFNGELATRHRGLDFHGALGEPVHAVNDGVVVLVGHDFYLYGNCVLVDHGAGLFTLYGHLSQAQVQVGDRVARGQSIGQVGNSGRSTGAHLHLGARLWGEEVNPEDLWRVFQAPRAND